MSEKREQLTAEELAVLQSRYGLDLAVTAIGNTDPRQLDRLEASALRKLRHQTLETMRNWRQAV